MFVTTRRSSAALAVGALFASGFTQVVPLPAAEAAVGWAGIDDVTRVLLPQSTFSVGGDLGNRTPRQVTLKARSGGVERTIARTRSQADGTYTFTGVRLPASAEIRTVTAKQTVAVAAGPTAQRRYRKAVKQLPVEQKRLRRVKKKVEAGKLHAGHLRKAKFGVRLAKKRIVKARAKLVRQVTVPRAESRWKPVTVVPRQSVRIAALPPIAAAGPRAAAPTEGHIISAGFVPARAGRAVTLERQVDGTWTEVATGVQDGSGHGVFTVPTAGTYRMRTAATGEADEVVSASATTGTWSVKFEDQFNGAALDTDNWIHQPRAIGNGYRTCARSDGTQSSVSGGVLRMGVGKDPQRRGQTCAYTDDEGVKHKLPYMVNTQIASEGLHSFRYGFFAARMKVQKAVGMHSAFWMNPNQALVPGRPDLGTEVDIMEYFGTRTQQRGIAAFVHTLHANRVLTKEGREFPATLGMTGSSKLHEQYHVFSLEWTPTHYVFRLDGREFHRTTRSISHAPQYMLLSNLTSSYELVDLKDPDDEALVDWVRVWQ